MADPITPADDEIETINGEHNENGEPTGTHEHDDAEGDDLEEDDAEQDDENEADSDAI